MTYSASQKPSSIKQEGGCFTLIWEQQEENRRWRSVMCSCLGMNSAQHGEEGSWRTGIMMCEFSELCSYSLIFSTKASLSLKGTQLGCVVRETCSQTQRTVLAYKHHPYMLLNMVIKKQWWLKPPKIKLPHIPLYDVIPPQVWWPYWDISSTPEIVCIGKSCRTSLKSMLL